MEKIDHILKKLKRDLEIVGSPAIVSFKILF